jgi:hypothetical protein
VITLRIFLSSPEDVRPERVRAYDVLQKLQTKFRAFIRIEPIVSEPETMRTAATFSVLPSKADIFVCILWARIPSGTEWELENVHDAYLERGMPDFLVYRKTAPPTITVSRDNQLAEWEREKKELNPFLDSWSRYHEETLKAAFNTFSLAPLCPISTCMHGWMAG